MGDQHSDDDAKHLLEVTGGAGEPKIVHCPRRAGDVPLHECLGCKRYSSLTLDPNGKHVFIDCGWEGPDDVANRA